jgi:N-acetyl-anhydromuramyl-L-alanine amidase AmpD
VSGRFSWATPEAIRTRDPRYPVDRIVLHAADGTAAGTEAWFKMSPEERIAAGGSGLPTATHYLVGRSGDVVQMVPDEEKAIHAGSTTQPGWNDRSIGLEFEVRITAAGWDPHLHFPLNDWTEPMLASGARVVAVLCRKYAIPVDRTHIVGHCEIPGHGSHIDPGSAFPWERFVGMVVDVTAGR